MINLVKGLWAASSLARELGLGFYVCVWTPIKYVGIAWLVVALGGEIF